VLPTTRRPATVPPTPLPGITGRSGLNGPGSPARICVSTNVMFANATSITTWPASATGSGASVGTSTSGGPNSLSNTARMSISGAPRSSWRYETS
jgi:hypothetical protein